MSAPERRTDPRVQCPPLVLSIEGRRYESEDWSLSGFRLSDYARDLRPRDRLRGLVGLAPDEPSDYVEAEVIRVTERDGIGLRIMEIAPSTFQSMMRTKNL